MTKIAVIYYSAYGHTYELARSLEESAKSAGAQTRLRKVRELAPDEVIATQQGWHDHRVATQHVSEPANVFYHWGAIIVPTGYTDPSVFAGGNPYGTSNTASEPTVSEAVLAAARHQGARLARFAGLIAPSRVKAN